MSTSADPASPHLTSPILEDDAELKPDNDDDGDGDVKVLASGSGSGSGLGAGKEGQTVGEVRRKVEKMNWKEGMPVDVAELEGQGEGERVDSEETSSVSKDKNKRKVLERSESSFAQDDLAVKKPRDTPVSHFL
jgi:hypothetical protein